MDDAIKTVAVVDDQPDNRKQLSAAVADVDLGVWCPAGPFATMEPLLAEVRHQSQAALFDHDLTAGGYAGCTGAEAVAALVRGSGFPAVLVTRKSETSMPAIRAHLRWIPMWLHRREADGDRLLEAWQYCRQEIQSHFLARREPVRVSLWFESLDKAMSEIVVPAWNPEEVVAYPIDQLPEHIRARATPGFQCYAKANLGARCSEELYICDFED